LSEAAIALAAGCVLQIAEATFTPRQGAIIEELHLEVIADPVCPWIDVTLPRGAVLGDTRVRQRLGDGSGKRLGPERWEATPRSIDGRGTARLHVPELVSGDRVVVDLERLLAGPVDWRPGPARYVKAEVRGGASLARLPGGERAEGSVWASEIDGTWGVRVGGVEGPPPLPDRAPAGDVRIEERLTLNVPPGDPQISLFPGGGSSVSIQRFLAFSPGERERAWPISAPLGAEVAFSATPSGAAALERDATPIGPGSARIVVPPNEAAVRVTVQWEEPDAPTYGERAPGVDALAVSAPSGEVRWEGDGWWLLGAHDRLVTPSRDLLIRALERRFRQAAIPEPGAPMGLRGRPPDWALVADLRPALLERAAIGRWPNDPLWVRKLVRARKGGALTPTEAAVTLWMYARQLQLDADWALVRPAPAGPGSSSVPTGIAAALVRVKIGAESRWIDPACEVCGPFELPPELEGAAAFGPGIHETPPPTPGRFGVRVRPDEVAWQLEGPPALQLRQWLASWPEDQRTERLAERIGGPGAALLSVEGIEQAGEPIRARATRTTDSLETPLHTAPPDPSGTVWVDWIGERLVVWEDHDVPETEVIGEVASWRRERTDRGVVERLTVRERRIPAAEAAAIDEARYGPPLPPATGQTDPPASAPEPQLSRPGPDPDPP
jgi:hypothetical protein